MTAVRGRLATGHRLAAVLLLGFSSGLPLALTGQAMQAWLTVQGIDLATIGFLALVTVPYTFKFLWAPLMDRFEPPLLGRRRGWIVLCQLAIAGVLALMATLDPGPQTLLFAVAALVVAFLSASQDVVIDAYRTDLLPARERGLGASLSVFSYRIAMIVSGGFAFVWADQWQSWPKVYLVMAAIMVVLALISLVGLPGLVRVERPERTAAGAELVGFLAMVAGVVLGYFLAEAVIALIPPLAVAEGPWTRLLKLLLQLLAAAGLGLYAARRFRFHTLNQSLSSYFSRDGAVAFLVLVVLYKLGDAFAGVLSTPFLIQGMGYSQTEVGVVNKVFGLWLTILGVMIGGALLMKIRLASALLAFGILQMVSNLGFYFLAEGGKHALGVVTLPAFDVLVLSIDEAIALDTLLILVVGFENLCGGMGTAAFVALLMALCNNRFSATHYALLSALAVIGRVYVGPLSGVLAIEIGWPAFFLFSTAAALPGLLMVLHLRRRIETASRGAPAPD